MASLRPITHRRGEHLRTYLSSAKLPKVHESIDCYAGFSAVVIHFPLGAKAKSKQIVHREIGRRNSRVQSLRVRDWLVYTLVRSHSRHAAQ